MNHPLLPLHHLYRKALLKRKFDYRNKLQLTKSVVLKDTPIPTSFSLSDKITDIYDQGQLGSCTANALCQAYRILCNNTYEPSRLALYFHERSLENTVMNDSGADPIDGVSWLQKNGICSESDWPYDISKYTITPPSSAEVNAEKHKFSQNYNIDESSADTLLQRFFIKWDTFPLITFLYYIFLII